MSCVKRRGPVRSASDLIAEVVADQLRDESDGDFLVFVAEQYAAFNDPSPLSDYVAARLRLIAADLEDAGTGGDPR